MRRLHQLVHELAFGLLLRLCEKSEQSSGAAEGTGEITLINWWSSSVPSVSGRSVYPFQVLMLRSGGNTFRTTLSPAQAMAVCAYGEQMIKDQMLQFGHTAPLEWDTRGSKFRFVEEEKE